MRIYSYSIINWAHAANSELVCNGQLYVFPDENFGPLRNCGSLQSYIDILGMACSSNGDIARVGHFLEDLICVFNVDVRPLYPLAHLR